ncbi:MAG: DUF2778 domain-containing protein [Planctomycetes bacterium]|nr:DUF2778 domain-containing protein [Planctomycetota bacterium]
MYSTWTPEVQTDFYDYEFKYSVERQKKKGEGPIPVGDWWVNICEESSALGLSFRLQSFRHWYAKEAWGSYSVPLHPESSTETHGRYGFFIHGGRYWGSAGCIDIKTADRQLDKLFAKAYRENGCKCCYVPVEVAYTYETVVKRETITKSVDYGP